MEQLWLCLLVLVSLSGAFSQSDVYKKAFVFPEETDTSYVTLTAQLQKPLMAFTVCLWFYTDLTRDYSLFSYATNNSNNDILIYRDKNRVYSLSVGGDDAYFSLPKNNPGPVHLCSTWDSDSGIAELWVDGEPMVRRRLKKGYEVGTDASIILGQEQDAYGGAFDKEQSLVGDTGDVNMWDSVLSPEDIRSVYSGSIFSPTVLDWRELQYEIHGDVVIRPQLWPMAEVALRSCAE
ncbi:C-reactive protein [Erinaceus europaeus]|uniref:Pentraxin family member n=1 Tax=Erinaceus europaeus TaxID=9365 RepID=A0A1S3A7M1_ERIEU|nr:C-reactive protein [Erinaceus europaeus]